MAALLAISITFILLVVYRCTRLLLNYVGAIRIGLPIVIVPTNWQDPLWIVFGKKLAWLQSLPFGLGSWYHYSFLGWNLNDRYTTHELLGGAFTMVTSNKNEIYICDPVNIHEAMGKHKRWLRPRELYSLFETFGPNVDSVDGEDWQRHRKVINHAFVEGNMETVWNSATG